MPRVRLLVLLALLLSVPVAFFLLRKTTCALTQELTALFLSLSLSLSLRRALLLVLCLYEGTCCASTHIQQRTSEL